MKLEQKINLVTAVIQLITALILLYKASEKQLSYYDGESPHRLWRFLIYKKYNESSLLNQMEKITKLITYLALIISIVALIFTILK